MFKEGDIISNVPIFNNEPSDRLCQVVLLLSDSEPNRYGTRGEYPYIAKVKHIKGHVSGEVVDLYHLRPDYVYMGSIYDFVAKIPGQFRFKFKEV